MKPIGRPRKRRDTTTKKPKQQLALDDEMGAEAIRRGWWAFHEDGSWTRLASCRDLIPDGAGGWIEGEASWPEARFMFDEDGEIVPWRPEGQAGE